MVFDFLDFVTPCAYAQSYHGCHFNVLTMDGRTDTFDINHWWNTIPNNLCALFTFTAARHDYFSIAQCVLSELDRCIGQLIIHGFQHRIHTFAKYQIILTVAILLFILWYSIFACCSRVRPLFAQLNLFRCWTFKCCYNCNSWYIQLYAHTHTLDFFFGGASVGWHCEWMWCESNAHPNYAKNV